MIGKGDKFRMVKGEGLVGKKFTCSGTAKERINGGHEGLTLIKFTTTDYWGKPLRMAVPLDWVAYEPPNQAARRKRP